MISGCLGRSLPSATCKTRFVAPDRDTPSNSRKGGNMVRGVVVDV